MEGNTQSYCKHDSVFV